MHVFSYFNRRVGYELVLCPVTMSLSHCVYVYIYIYAGFNLRSSWSAQFSQRAVIKTLAMVGFLASLLYRTVS